MFYFLTAKKGFQTLGLGDGVFVAVSMEQCCLFVVSIQYHLRLLFPLQEIIENFLNNNLKGLKPVREELIEYVNHFA